MIDCGTITPDSVAFAFGDKFPAIDTYPEMREYYEKLWDEQKNPDYKHGKSNIENLCDTPEWWLKALED